MNEEHQDLLREIRDRFARAQNAERDNREAAHQDLQFMAGESQWDDTAKAARVADGRPVLTINRMPQFVRQVLGDIRQNRPAIRVGPSDDQADQDIAKLLEGLIRQIERASNGQRVYINAAESSVACGIGHFRVLTEYSNDDAFEQDIRIRLIKNALSVYWDPSAEDPLKRDARYCFVSTFMDEDEFRETYPNASLTDFDHEEQEDRHGDWHHENRVRVVEYWVKEPTTKKLAQVQDAGKVITVDITDVPEEELADLNIVNQREVLSHKVRWYLATGSEILEDDTEWAGRYIPIIPVVGEETQIGERTVRCGIIRHAKDPQRMYNYWRSAQTEQVALQPKAPWLATAKQVKNYLTSWKTANTDNKSVLLYDVDEKAPPPQRQMPPVISQGMTQEVGLAADDMKATTGVYDAALGAKSNETSGVAIRARQTESDTGTFVYIDNLSAAIEYAGQILVDLIPRIYDTERQVLVLGEDDSEEFAAINTVVQGPEGPIVLNDLSVGEYDVTVTTGPAYSTRRIEAAQSMLDFAQAVPMSAQFIMDLIAKNMDWPGAEEISERLRKMLPPGVAEPTEEELNSPEAQQQAQAAQQQQFLQMMAQEIQMRGAEAKTQGDIAKAQKTTAEAEGQELENMQAQLEIAAATGGIEKLIESAVMSALARIAAADSGIPVQ